VRIINQSINPPANPHATSSGDVCQMSGTTAYTIGTPFGTAGFPTSYKPPGPKSHLRLRCIQDRHRMGSFLTILHYDRQEFCQDKNGLRKLRDIPRPFQISARHRSWAIPPWEELLCLKFHLASLPLVHSGASTADVRTWLAKIFQVGVTTNIL